MRSTLQTILTLFSFLLTAQQGILPTFDGVVSAQEWKGAKNFSIKYEIDPGNNIPSPHLTDVFITY